MSAPLTSDQKLEKFVNALVESLRNRYDKCEDFAATPSNVLLAVLNAVADARQAADL